MASSITTEPESAEPEGVDAAGDGDGDGERLGLGAPEDGELAFGDVPEVPQATSIIETISMPGANLWVRRMTRPVCESVKRLPIVRMRHVSVHR